MYNDINGQIQSLKNLDSSLIHGFKTNRYACKKKIIKSLSLNCCKHDNKMNTKSKINKIKRKKSSTLH